MSINSNMNNNSFLILDYHESSALNDKEAQPKQPEAKKQTLRVKKKTFLLNHENEPIFETMNRMQQKRHSVKPYSRNTTHPSLTMDVKEHSIGR